LKISKHHEGGVNTGRRLEVALLVETSKTFGRGILRGITRYVRTHEPWSIYIDERGVEDPLPGWLKPWRGDGVILRTARMDVLEAVRKLNVPAVFLGETQPGAMPMLKSDDEAIVNQLTDHLLERGFPRFAYVGLSGKHWSTLRRDHLMRRLQRDGYPCELFEFKLRRGRYDAWPRQEDRLIRWLNTLTPPVAIVACYDVMGLRVLNACRSAGIAVPEQAAVIGIDDDALLCELANPPLTSVAHDLERIGYEASVLLERLARGEKLSSEPIYIPPAGISTRQSTDVLAIDDEMVARAVEFIRQHACTGIRVRDVVEHVGCSRVTLNRRFRAVFKHSVKDEILRLQIRRCRQLLRETDYTLPHIAALAGFKHPEYMSVAFRRETGQTPGGYRKGRT